MGDGQRAHQFKAYATTQIRRRSHQRYRTRPVLDGFTNTEEQVLQMASGSSRNENMSDDLTLFSSPELKDIVQDMRDLLSQNRLAFLLGAGCSRKAGLPLMPKLTEEILGYDKIGKKTKELLNTWNGGRATETS